MAWSLALVGGGLIGGLLGLLTKGHIHEIRVPGVRSGKDGHPVLHPVGYYTLRQIPNS